MIRKRSCRLICIAFWMTFLTIWGCRGSIPSKSAVVKNHKISLELFPNEHTFNAKDEMQVEHGSKIIPLHLNKNFKINSIIVNGKRADFRFADLPEKEKEKKLTGDNFAADFSKAGIATIFSKSAGEHSVIIDYEGKLFEEPTTSQFSREYIANQTTGLISEQGAFLSPESFWYPKGDEKMTRFEVVTTTPAGYETITQGTRLRHEVKSDKLIVQWKNDHSSDALFLQAGPYDVQEGEVDSIKVYTYFFKESDKFASLYLRKSMQYIEMYNKLLGRYPYDKFAVVENFFETGYGLPSWTLLGKTVIRLPFIPDTSLPHEICHNWWGNGVFVDYDRGNWCEGLTVYCADYRQKKMMPGGDVDYRRQINRDYASYIKENNEFPLTEFRSRHNPATRAVGYGKTMMVFHDLERRVGEDKFYSSLRRLMAEYAFKSAGWDDVIRVFEKECGVSLDAFYRQWVERTGAPLLRLKKVRSVEREGVFFVTFTIVQEDEPYNLDVPILVTTTYGEIRKDVKVSESSEEFEMSFNMKPFRLEVDPEYHLFRRLYPEEIPPSIAKVFGSESQFIVVGKGVDSEKTQEYKDAAEMINKTKTAVIKDDKEITLEELSSKSDIILGSVSEESVVSRFLRFVQKVAPWERAMEEREDAVSVVVYDHPDNSEYGIMLIRGNSKSDIISVVRKLPHYGKYSYLLFHGSENVERGIWEVKSSPLIYLF